MSIADLKELIVFVNEIVESEPTEGKRFKRAVTIRHKLTKLLSETQGVIKNHGNPNFRRTV